MTVSVSKFPTYTGEITHESGKRLYLDEKGREYTSVTTLLSNYEDKSFLDSWKERIGEEEANRIRDAAALRGTIAHSQIESYFEAQRSNTVAEFSGSSPYATAAIDKFYSRVSPVREEDVVLWEPYPGCRLAGRFDQLIYLPENTFRYCDTDEEVAPGVVICDLKTKDKQPRLDKIDFVIKHLLQISTYAKMLSVTQGVDIVGGCVVFAVVLKTKTACRIIRIDKEDMEFYWGKVFDMLLDFNGIAPLTQTWSELIDEASCHYDFLTGQFSSHKPREIF